MSRDRSRSTDEVDESDDVRDRSASGLFGRVMTGDIGWSPLYNRGEADETTAGTDDEAAVIADEEDDGSWWDEGLIGLLIVVGVVLFFFPEPATSAVGIGLLILGALAWLVDAFT